MPWGFATLARRELDLEELADQNLEKITKTNDSNQKRVTIEPKFKRKYIIHSKSPSIFLRLVEVGDEAASEVAGVDSGVAGEVGMGDTFFVSSPGGGDDIGGDGVSMLRACAPDPLRWLGLRSGYGPGPFEYCCWCGGDTEGL